MSDEPLQRRFDFDEPPAEPEAPPDESDEPPTLEADPGEAEPVDAEVAIGGQELGAEAPAADMKTPFGPTTRSEADQPREPEPLAASEPQTEPIASAPRAAATPDPAPEEHAAPDLDGPAALVAAAQPAPVVTEEGEYWFPGAEEAALARRELHEGRWAPWRHLGAWVAGLALIAVGAAAIGAHSVAQATSEEVALPALRRAVEALAEPEALLELHSETIAEEAAAADPGSTVEVPGYPVVGVGLKVEDAASNDLARMSDALLDASAARVHVEGRSALAAGGLAPPTSDRLSTAGAVAGLLDSLTADNHDRWSRWRTALLVLATLLAAVVVVLPRGFGGVLGLGAALLAAGIVVAGGAIVLRIALSLAGGEGPLLDEYLRISRELTRIPLRNGLVLAAAGVALALPAALLRALFERSVASEPSAAARH